RGARLGQRLRPRRSKRKPKVASDRAEGMANFKDLKSRRAVMAAFAEFDRLGPEAFHARYGYRAADTYTARYEGREYPSKAIVGVAYGFQYPDQGPLTSDQFSGGKAAAAGHLARLGFVVDGVVITDDHWTLEEV